MKSKLYQIILVNVFVLLCVGHFDAQYKKTISDSTNLSSNSKYVKCLFVNSVYFIDNFMEDAWFKNSTFAKNANFSGVRPYANLSKQSYTESEYFKNVVFNTTFNADAIFEGVRFNGNAIFSRDTIKGNCYFSNSSFTKQADFAHAVFYRDAHFEGSIFDNSAEFSGTDFHGYMYFDFGKIANNAIFTNAIFRQGFFSSGSVFSGLVDFSSAIFKGDADFSGSIFKKWLSFRGLRISDTTSPNFGFYNTTLPDTLDFSYNPKIPNAIDLSVANFRNNLHSDSSGSKEYRKHEVYLYKSDISKIYFDYLHFKLLLSDPRQKNAELSNDDKESIYETVLKNFKDRGQIESYELLDREYRHFKEGALWGTIDNLWWDYGYSKGRIFRWTLIFLIAFTFITYIFIGKLQNGVYAIKMVRVYPISNPLRLWHALIYTAAIFFPLSFKFDKIKSTGGWLAYVVFVYLVGLLCVAYLANFIIQR